MCLIANLCRTKKQKPWKPDDFNPIKDPPPPLTPEQIAARQAAREKVIESLIPTRKPR